ncbi:MAG: Transcriptional activator protein Anr [Luteibacter sp.]|uniref:Crp/Fnr family transcriptional regulator n=1 Tax=Luteibacter sp. TaxID=1886636 RepID=UPI0013844C69|nr:Crp/Fnr family transcriptional regulator [Luteibacter sp.]KAF1005823.1 MAG: Transcriptional activator protein Anr [Luteibacter sp.]
MSYAPLACVSPVAQRRPNACCNASCRHASACEATRGGDERLLDMRSVVERVGPFSEGDRLVQPGAPHRAAFTVLTGFAKTVGDGRVLAFHLPGELFALDIARSHTHDVSVVAVGKTWFCRFPKDATDDLGDTNTDIAQHLRHLRRRERQVSSRSGDGSALQRVAGLLADLLRRRRAIEGPGQFVPLPMSREDIGSYLGMSTATVTRMLARLRDSEAIAIRADGVDVLNEGALLA